MKTVRRRTWLVAMVLGLLSLAMQVGTVAAGPTVVPINPQLFCIGGLQCIENVQVTPHGQFANISFHTSVSQFATIQVSTVPPKKLADGTLSYNNLPVDSFALTPSSSQHSAEMDIIPLHLHDAEAVCQGDDHRDRRHG